MINKTFISSIIIISFVIQIGILILDKTRFSYGFKICTGILFLTFFILNFSSCIKTSDISFYYSFDKSHISDQDSSLIITEFQGELEDMIKSDIHNKYYVNVNVEVIYDLDKLQIYIGGISPGDNIISIENYIKNKYCAENDEVIIINENSG